MEVRVWVNQVDVVILSYKTCQEFAFQYVSTGHIIGSRFPLRKRVGEYQGERYCKKEIGDKTVHILVSRFMIRKKEKIREKKEKKKEKKKTQHCEGGMILIYIRTFSRSTT